MAAKLESQNYYKTNVIDLESTINIKKNKEKCKRQI